MYVSSLDSFDVSTTKTRPVMKWVDWRNQKKLGPCDEPIRAAAKGSPVPTPRAKLPLPILQASGTRLLASRQSNDSDD